MFVSLLIFVSSYSYEQTVPTMRYEDKIRIREAIAISQFVGEDLWKGINEVPFVVLLVTDSGEFLINHPYPSKDFVLSEVDMILNTKIMYRNKHYPDWYLATFPAVNGVNCIVVGTPEKTNKNSTNWIITLLHEHFHQYQFTSPKYYDDVSKLELSGDDETGMWQLNYAFPYDDLKTVNQYEKYAFRLLKAVSNLERKRFKKDFRRYLRERSKFKKLLNASDYRYFSFQIWQEGIARYTEYKFIDQLDTYRPTSEVTQLKDYVSFKDFKSRFYHAALKSITQSKLETEKRISFYAIGFAEGILLDKINPDWKKMYLTDKFYIENYFEKK